MPTLWERIVQLPVHELEVLQIESNSSNLVSLN